jgi:hypothetical protein
MWAMEHEQRATGGHRHLIDTAVALAVTKAEAKAVARAAKAVARAAKAAAVEAAEEDREREQWATEARRRLFHIAVALAVTEAEAKAAAEAAEENDVLRYLSFPDGYDSDSFVCMNMGPV